MARTANGKNIPIPKTLNHSTGKVSGRQTGFNDITWGKSTRSYSKSIQRLSDDKFQAIINRAMEFSKTLSVDDGDDVVLGGDDEDDERAQLVDIDSEDEDEDEDEECKSIYTFSLPSILTECCRFN